MPIYDYECTKCDSRIEVVKPMSQCSRKEQCEVCFNDLNRVFTTFHTIGTKVQDAEFNHGLGKVIKNKYDRSETAKKMGVVEVGNDFVSGDKMQTEFEKKKREDLDKSYELPKDFSI